MNFLSPKFRLLFVVWCFFLHSLDAQQSRIQSFDDDGNLDSLFDARIGIENTVLQLGLAYENYNWPRTVHPFYLSNNWMKGSVVYRGQLFKNVLLRYDIQSQILLLKNLVDVFDPKPIALLDGQVASFSLGDRNFHFFQPHEVEALGGFYEILYDGSIYQLVAKREKREQLSGGITFDEVDTYFLFTTNHYRRIRRKKDLSEILGDDGKVKELIKESKLKPFRMKGQDLAQLIENYEKQR